jgi:hypothetical protein
MTILNPSSLRCSPFELPSPRYVPFIHTTAHPKLLETTRREIIGNMCFAILANDYAAIILLVSEE